jgi:hypothetical protein
LVPAGCEISVKSLALLPIPEPSHKKRPFLPKLATKKKVVEMFFKKNPCSEKLKITGMDAEQ